MRELTISLHEDLTRKPKPRGSSDRSFGGVFTAFFAVVGLWPLRFHQHARIWPLVLAGALLVTTVLRPAWLRPLNQLWMKFGLLLSRLISPIVATALFLLVFAPMGFLSRLLGKDPLRLKFDAGAQTYWIQRRPPGPPPESMSNQF
jgi:hypothetical protein